MDDGADANHWEAGESAYSCRKYRLDDFHSAHFYPNYARGFCIRMDDIANSRLCAAADLGSDRKRCRVLADEGAIENRFSDSAQPLIMGFR